MDEGWYANEPVPCWQRQTSMKVNISPAPTCNVANAYPDRDKDYIVMAYTV